MNNRKKGVLILNFLLPICIVSLLVWIFLPGIISFWNKDTPEKNCAVREIVYDELIASQPNVIIAAESEDKLPFNTIQELVSSSISVVYKEKSGNTISIDVLCQKIEEAFFRIAAIEKVSVIFLSSPSQFLIRYTLRKPIACIQQNKHTSPVGVDREGVIFHLYPIYTPKELPTLILPESVSRTDENRPQEIVKAIQSMRILYSLFNASSMGFFERSIDYDNWVFRIVRVDFSKFFHFCYFQREVIITLYAKKNSSLQKGIFFFRFPSDFSTYISQERLMKFMRLACRSSQNNMVDTQNVHHTENGDCTACIFDFRFKEFCLYQQIPAFRNFERFL